MALSPDMRVLIVDDHKTMLRIVRNMLAQINITQVDEATDGEAALRKLLEEKYDLILSDWNMQPMPGLQFLQQVRRDVTYRHTHVPFILVTAEARPENVMEARNAGVDNYIVKPFNAETLESKISTALQKRAQS
jgi:two-component system chemotaxis response regulator CheY